MQDNPERNMKNSVHSWVRTRDSEEGRWVICLLGQNSTLPSNLHHYVQKRKRASEFSIDKQIKALQRYFVIYFHQHYLHRKIFHVFLFYSPHPTFYSINPNYRVLQMTSAHKLLRTSECLLRYRVTCLKNWENLRQIWFRINGVLSEIRTQHRPNTKVQKYRYASPLGALLVFWH
jgi:hypothetical protein